MLSMVNGKTTCDIYCAHLEGAGTTKVHGGYASAVRLTHSLIQLSAIPLNGSAS